MGVYSNGKLVDVATVKAVTPKQYECLIVTFNGTFDFAFHSVHATSDTQLAYSLTLDEKYRDELLKEIEE